MVRVEAHEARNKECVVPLLGSAGQPGLIYRQNIWLASSVVGTVNGNANMVWLASGLQFSIVCSLFIRCHRMLWSISEFLRAFLLWSNSQFLRNVFVVKQIWIVVALLHCLWCLLECVIWLVLKHEGRFMRASNTSSVMIIAVVGVDIDITVLVNLRRFIEDNWRFIEGGWVL